MVEPEEDDASDEEELRELQELAEAEKRGHEEEEHPKSGSPPIEHDEESPAAPSPALLSEEAFARIQAEMQAILPTYAQQIQMMSGKALPLEIAWDSLERRADAIGELLNAALTPVLGGFAFLGQDMAMRAAIGEHVDKIIVRKAAGPAEHGFALKDRVLVYSAFMAAGMPMMDPQTASGILRAILSAATAAALGNLAAAPPPEEKKSAPAKPKSAASKPKPKPAAKKTPPAKPKKKR
jgi:hypothetical protein